MKETKKKQTHLQMNARRNNKVNKQVTNPEKIYLVGADLQSSVSEQCLVAAVITAALNASSRGWFH